jgi:hypothetical protein
VLVSACSLALSGPRPPSHQQPIPERGVACNTTLLESALPSAAAATAELLWACASLSLQPSPQWLKAFLTTAARAADAGRFSVQQLGTVVWSLAVVKPQSQELLMSQQLQVQVRNAFRFAVLPVPGSSGSAITIAQV